MRSEHFQVPSRAFGDLRDVTVLVPDDYRKRRRRYPVLYLHDGAADWLGRGGLCSAIESAACPPFLTVMPAPVNRTREYKLDERHLRFMTEDLVPWVDAHLRTRRDAAHRAVHGVSLGGLCAVALGLRHPEVFGAAGGQGGAFWYARRRIVREARSSAGCTTRFHLVCGRLDGNLDDNRALRDALTEAGIIHVYEEGRGKHSWPFWHRTLPSALQTYFSSC